MNSMRNFFGNRNSGMGGMMPANNGVNPFGNMMNIVRQFRQFMQNPVGAMLEQGVNIPQNIQGNPEAIVNYMRSSGQMSDDQFSQVSQMAQMAQGFFGKRN